MPKLKPIVIRFVVFFYFSALFITPPLRAESFKSDRLGVKRVLKVGDTFEYSPESYRVTLKGIDRHESECAVPGFNCGAGYHPNPIFTPQLEVTTREECAGRMIPDSCSVVHRAEMMEGNKQVKVWFTKFYEVCDPKDDRSNYESCLFRQISNSHDQPPRHPKHCDLIKNPTLRDGCVQFIADKLADHNLCNLMNGPMGFQCVLLKAKAAGKPETCRTLQKGPQHHSDKDWKDQIESCLNAAKR